MIKIYKYPVPVLDEFEIAMPENAHVLTVQTQNGNPFIWAKVDTDAPIVPRRFQLVGTGNPTSGLSNVYVGTFQIADGRLVFHLFDRG